MTYSTATDELPTLAIGAVAVLPWNTDIVLIGTGEGTGAGRGANGVGILRSTDGGATWDTTNVTSPVSESNGYCVIEANPSTHTILAGASDGLWRSTDDGLTWTQVKEGGTYYDVKWKPGDPNRVYTAKGSGATANNVKVSTDDGLTWTKAGAGQPFGIDVGKTKIAVCPAAPDVIYANYTNSHTYQTLGIYRSDDNGATWDTVYAGPNMTGGQGWYNLTLAVDPNDVDRVIAGGVKLYPSTDGGVNFDSTGTGYGLGTGSSVHWDHHAITYEPGSDSIVWVGTDGGVWRSTDDGETWESRREGLVTYQFYDICIAQSDPAFMMGGTQDNGVPGRVNADEWFTSTLFADGMVCNVTPTNADQIFAESQFGNHVRSNNGGQSWRTIMQGIPSSSGAWITPVDQDQNAPEHLFTYQNGTMYRTWSSGNVWVDVGGGQAKWISISPVDGEMVWTVGSSIVRYTTDDGDTWNTAASFGFGVGNATKIQAHPTDVNTAFVTFSGYGSYAHVAMTTDMGASWTDVTGDFPSQPVNTMIADPVNPDIWFIGTDVGVWSSTNGGTAWLPFETGFPNAVVTDLEIRRDARKLVAGTYGRGSWEIDLHEATGVADSRPIGSSLNLMLDPAAPNPFRSQTLLRFAAKSDAPVVLDVFDIRGRRVERLADLPRGDGVIRNMQWSADGLASGVYFLRLRAGGEELARRVVITR